MPKGLSGQISGAVGLRARDRNRRSFRAAFLLASALGLAGCFADDHAPDSQPHAPDPQPVNLEGRIVNADGGSLSRVAVHLKTAGLADTTDDDGAFHLQSRLGDRSDSLSRSGWTGPDTLELSFQDQLIYAEPLDGLRGKTRVEVHRKEVRGEVAHSSIASMTAKVFRKGSPDRSYLTYRLAVGEPDPAGTGTRTFSGNLWLVFPGGGDGLAVVVEGFDKEGKRMAIGDTAAIDRYSTGLDFPSDRVHVINLSGTWNVEGGLCCWLKPGWSRHGWRVGAGDTIQLRNGFQDSPGSRILSSEISIGSGPTGPIGLRDTFFVAPAASDSDFSVAWRVRDENGTVREDHLRFLILRDPPVPRIASSQPATGCPIRLTASATQLFGRVVRWEWSTDSGKTFRETPDSSYSVCPDSAATALVLVRATDGGGNAGEDSLRVFRRREEAFDSASFAHWSAPAGRWTFPPSAIGFLDCDASMGDRPCTIAGEGIAVDRNREFREFKARIGNLDFRYPSSTELRRGAKAPGAWIGLVFGYRDSANFLVGAVGPRGTEIVRFADGSRSLLASATKGYFNSTYQIPEEWIVTEDSLTVPGFIQAALPSGSGKGYLGLYGRDEGIRYQSFVVEPPR